VVLLGNIPPRDVLAQATPDDVRRWKAGLLEATKDRRRLMISCGGGTSPQTPAANLDALLE
jgi:uroporphyrinogen decarboxylase